MNRRVLAGALVGLALGTAGVTGYLVRGDDPADPIAPPAPAPVASAEPSASPSPTRVPSSPPEPPAATTAGSVTTPPRATLRPRSPRATTTRPPTSPPPVRQTDPDVVPTYPNCEQMRADHPAGVDRTHPAYRLWLDLDLDGYACEPE